MASPVELHHAAGVVSGQADGLLVMPGEFLVSEPRLRASLASSSSEVRHSSWFTYTSSSSAPKLRESSVLVKVPKCLAAAMLVTVPGVPERAVLNIDGVVCGVPLFPLHSMINPGQYTWQFKWHNDYWTFYCDQRPNTNRFDLQFGDFTLKFGKGRSLNRADAWPTKVPAWCTIFTRRSSTHWRAKLPEDVADCVAYEQMKAGHGGRDPRNLEDVPPIIWRGKTPPEMKAAIHEMTATETPKSGKGS